MGQMLTQMSILLLGVVDSYHNFGVLSAFLNLFLQWRIIVGGTKCIPKSELPGDEDITTNQGNRQWAYPSDLTIALSASVPLYPPGRIIHVVHNHPEEQW